MHIVPRIPWHYRFLRRLPTRPRLCLVYLGSPKMTVGASAVIWDTAGCVLLVHHTYRRPAWGLPSGLVKRREDPGTALARELREELGVPATVDALLHAETHGSARHLTLYYQMKLHGTPHYDNIEIDRVQYVSLEDLESLTGARQRAWLWTARTRLAAEM